MESLHLSQQHFADKVGLSPASLSNIFNDRTKPTLNHVDAIVKSFPTVSLPWLLYGQGEMFNVAGSGSSATSADPAATGADDMLMLDFGDSSTPQQSNAAMQQQNSGQRQVVGMNMTPRPEREVVKYIDKPQRQITEIRIYYDDHTWETFERKK